MTDPASGMERREFGGLVGLVEMAWLTHCNYGGDIEHCNDAREDLYRWHLAAVERAVREARAATVREVVADLRGADTKAPRILFALADAFESALEAELNSKGAVTDDDATA